MRVRVEEALPTSLTGIRTYGLHFLACIRNAGVGFSQKMEYNSRRAVPQRRGPPAPEAGAGLSAWLVRGGLSRTGRQGRAYRGRGLPPVCRKERWRPWQRRMEAVVFVFSLLDCCALIFLSVYFVSLLRRTGDGAGLGPCGGRRKCVGASRASGAGPGARSGRAVADVGRYLLSGLPGGALALSRASGGRGAALLPRASGGKCLVLVGTPWPAGDRS